VVAPLTKLAARALLITLGYSLDVEDGEYAAVLRANRSSAFVVANCVSYVDVLVLTAVLGPLALRCPRPARGAPLAALLCAADAPGLVFPEGQHTAGGCMLPFSADALAAAAPAARNSPALRAFVLPAALSYRAANSFNAAWTRRGPAAGLSHAAQLTAAWMKHARVQLQPLQILPNEGAFLRRFCYAFALGCGSFSSLGRMCRLQPPRWLRSRRTCSRTWRCFYSGRSWAQAPRGMSAGGAGRHGARRAAERTRRRRREGAEARRAADRLRLSFRLHPPPPGASLPREAPSACIGLTRALPLPQPRSSRRQVTADCVRLFYGEHICLTKEHTTACPAAVQQHRASAARASCKHEETAVRKMYVVHISSLPKT